jgi:hypothetical protein
MKKKRFSVPMTPVLACMVAAFATTRCGQNDSPADKDTQSKVNSIIEVQPGTTLLVGRGFNSVRAEVLGDCVKRGALTTIGGNAQTTRFSMKQIETVEDLKESLSVSASGSFGYGVYSGSAKASYMKSKDFSSNSSYLLVSVRVENQTEVLDAYEFTDSARALLKANKRTEFLARCGDEFVAAKTTGGEFTAIVEFMSKTEEQKQKISAAIKGSGGTWNVAADFKSSMEKLSKFSESKVTILRVGGSGELPNFNDLVDTALKFPIMITANNAWPYSVTTVSYDSVLDNDPNLPRPINLRQAQRFFEQISSAYLSLIKVRNDINYVLKNQNQFQDVDVNSLNAAQAALASEITQIESAPNRCFDAPDAPENCTVPSFTIPQVAYPKRFTNDSAVCTYKTERDFQEGKISQRTRDYLIAEDYVRLFKTPNEYVEVPCSYYVTLI